MQYFLYVAMVAYIVILVCSMCMYTECMPVNVFVAIIQACVSACIVAIFRELKESK